jgi:hypothetical protein
MFPGTTTLVESSFLICKVSNVLLGGFMNSNLPVQHRVHEPAPDIIHALSVKSGKPIVSPNLS